MTHIILASGSKYKAALLHRLSLPFEIAYPNIDEYAAEGELPIQAAERLALTKAKAIARKNIGTIVIGADQIADINGEAINKPGSHALAVQQLKHQSGREVIFHSGLAIVRCSLNGHIERYSGVNSTKVILEPCPSKTSNYICEQKSPMIAQEALRQRVWVLAYLQVLRAQIPPR